MVNAKFMPPCPIKGLMGVSGQFVKFTDTANSPLADGDAGETSFFMAQRPSAAAGAVRFSDNRSGRGYKFAKMVAASEDRVTIPSISPDLQQLRRDEADRGVLPQAGAGKSAPPASPMQGLSEDQGKTSLRRRPRTGAAALAEVLPPFRSGGAREAPRQCSGESCRTRACRRPHLSAAASTPARMRL